MIIIALSPTSKSQCFSLALTGGVIKPKKIIQNLIIKIELYDGEVLLFTEEKNIKSIHIKSKSNLQIFETTFLKYYTANFNSKEYYIIPEFFDNFKTVESNLNLGSN